MNPVETTEAATCAARANYQRHPTYFLDDGSLLIVCGAMIYRIHKTLITRHSRAIQGLLDNVSNDHNQDRIAPYIAPDDSASVCTIPAEMDLCNRDLDILLGHLYHDAPMTTKTPFPRVASILRASSPQSLDFPPIYALARNYIEAMFQGFPKPLARLDHLEEALKLADEYTLPIRKPVLYALVVSSNFNIEDSGDDPGEASLVEPALSPPVANKLTSKDAKSCQRLMQSIIDHFTPMLFTPAATPHMACTDVFADTWMPLVIQPALDDDSVYKPLESLQRIIDIDWASKGLCPSCVIEKRAEWLGEQEEVWRRMDGWI